MIFVHGVEKYILICEKIETKINYIEIPVREEEYEKYTKMKEEELMKEIESLSVSTRVVLD